MPFTMGDVSIEGTANIDVENANFSFANFLQINSAFNPIALGAELVLGVWKAEVERQRHEEQMAVLREISTKLDKLNQTASEILRALNDLPSRLGQVFGEELLKNELRTHWNSLDTARAALEHDRRMVVPHLDWRRLVESFHFVCANEFRASKIAAVPQTNEFMNYLSAGRDADLFSAFVRDCAGRVLNYQVMLGKAMADATAKYLKSVVDEAPRSWLGSFTKLVVDGNYREVQDIRDASFTARLIERPPNETPLASDLARISFVMQEVERQPAIQQALDQLKAEYVRAISEMFELFNTYSALRIVLGRNGEFPYRRVLKGAKPHVAHD